MMEKAKVALKSVLSYIRIRWDTIRWDTLGGSMGKTMVALKSILPTSTKFWLCLLVIIGGLAGSLIRGGPEGYAAAIAALTLYCGTKAYQNVKFAELNGNGKSKPAKSPAAPRGKS